MLQFVSDAFLFVIFYQEKKNFFDNLTQPITGRKTDRGGSERFQQTQQKTDERENKV